MVNVIRKRVNSNISIPAVPEFFLQFYIKIFGFLRFIDNVTIFK